MKVDTSKLKKGGSSELTPECRQLIDDITKCRTRAEILAFLETVQVWVFGKCELYHWIEILDRFDKVLEEAARHVNGNEFVLHCDTSFTDEDIRLLMLVLNFTTLLIEHSFSRHLYNSIEHLTELLSSLNMNVVLAVLNLLYMFSKRSNFIPRLSFEKKEMLLIKLFNIAERWGDPNYGLALIDCCMKKPKLEFLYQFLVEYVDESGHAALLEIPDMLELCKRSPPSDVVRTLCKQMYNPSDAIKMRIAHRVRLVSGFGDYRLRLQFVQARLQAVSVLIYSNALQDNIDRVLYPGFGEELCELIDKEDTDLVEIRAAVLRTLTSMLHFDRNPNVPRAGSRLPKIIQYTGAERQSGILPVLVRDCIASLTGDGPSDKYPLILATSLFSLLYHLASYEAGGHALLKSGMMRSLLRVISWPGVELEHITFVTRAVRVIDLITNIDIAKFHQNNGLNVFIERLEKEINCCRSAIAEQMASEGFPQMTQSAEQAQQIEREEAMAEDMMQHSNEEGGDNQSERRHSTDSDVILLDNANVNAEMGGDQAAGGNENENENKNLYLESDSSHQSISDRTERVFYPSNSYYAIPLNERNAKAAATAASAQQKKLACVTQRAALLKSMLNFLKKSIHDHSHFNGMRNIMETSLPSSLRHIISNAEFYGPSLFLLATDVVTVYVFNEPSLLSSLQDSGLTSIMLQSLLHKDVPATREVLGSLPNVFSALCLNERGLMEFMSYEPFDKLLKVLLSPDYLVAMRRRRSSDPLGDTATNLGNAMDDLMKHHPYLRTDATEAIVRLLNELVRLGSDPAFICWRANKDSSGANSNTNNGGSNGNGSSVNVQNLSNANPVDPVNNDNNDNNDSSGDDDDDDDEMSSASQQQRQNRQPVTSPHQQIENARENAQEREAIPLIDYILNVMKFIEAIFSNSSNGEHCREFVLHGGLKPLLQLLSLPNLPVDSPVSTTAQAVANVCKSILNLAQETKVINTALQQLSQIVANLKPLIKHFNFPGCSILLQELLSCPKLDDGFSIADYTPLLHSMSSVHGYVVMLVHLCRNASNEMRMTLLKRWGSNCPTGLQLLQNLVQLYISLVWESTILLGMCSDEPYAQNCDIGWDDMIAMEQSQNSKDKAEELDENSAEGSGRMLEKTSPPKVKLKPEDQLRYIKSLLAASSRLGRALAELFGTLVKLSVGSPQSRQRRNNDFVSAFFGAKFPNSDAKDIARVLSSILVNGFNHEDLLPKPAPKLKLTFLICSVGFTGPMLFDDKRSSFHLMISQFCEENGLKAFFDMFYWAISLGGGGKPSKFSFESCMKMENVLEDCEDDTRPFPEGTGEFLDAWLQLLEKMVNPRAILDSPYSIAPRAQNMPEPTVQFEPIFYLTQIHQLALQALRRIWKRKPITNYGLSMTETILTILKHLIKSHTMLNDRFKARLGELQNSNKGEQSKKPTQSDEANVNLDHVKMLMDMGFPRFHVVEALQNTRSLEQATDYLLNHTAAHSRESSDNAAGDFAQSLGNEMDIDADSSATVPDIGPSTSKIDQNAAAYTVNYEDMKLIPSEVFNEFCNETLDRTFEFMENLPETVNTGAELIAVLYRRNNPLDKHKFIVNLVKNVADYAETILRRLREPTPQTPQQIEEIMNGTLAAKLFIRLKVSTLLLDENYMDIRKEFCIAISQKNILNLLLMLLQQTEETLNNVDNVVKDKNAGPRWLRNLLEFIDAVDNVSVILQRKANMRAVCSDNWKWYDTTTGKWNAYSESNNTLIKNAFNIGERSVVISIGRQRYTINFNCMTQVSEASGNHRSVLPSLKITDAVNALLNNNATNKVETVLTRIIKAKGEDNKVVQHDEVINLQSLLKQPDQPEKKEVNPPPGGSEAATSSEDQQQTQNQQEKTEVASQNNSSEAPPTSADINSTTSTQTEDASAAPANFKKVKSKIYTKSSGGKKPVNAPPPAVIQKIIIHEETVGVAKFDTKKLISCLVRMLQPKVMINFETKLAVLKICARLTKDYENAKAFVQNEGIQLLLNMRQTCGMMGFPSYAIIIIRHVLEAPPVLQEAIERILSLRAAASVPVGHRDLIFVLTQVSSAVARQPSTFLNAAKQILRAEPALSGEDSRLLVKTQIPNKKTPAGIVQQQQPTSKLMEEDLALCQTSLEVVKQLLHAIVQPCIHYGGIATEDSEYMQEPVEIPETSSPSKGQGQKKTTEKFEPCCCSWHIPSSGHTHQKPILPRSTLIKTLADAVRSYQSLVPKAIVEHIFTPADSILIEKEQSCLSFILDNFLPIVRRQQDAEVSMMSRVLIASLADCYGHPQIQTKVIEELHEAIVRALTQSDSAEKHTRLQVLIGLLPAMIESPMLSNKVHVQRNNMYRIMLRQGIMNDLVKISQYKDLSNPHTLSTIYSILRPMEILLRLTVAPGTLASKRILFGPPSSQGSGGTSIMNRRHFPRFSRTIPNLSSNAIGDEYREYVLRDIIRNVLSDRRHVFDFFFNADDTFLFESEDATPAAGSSNPDDEVDDSEPDGGGGNNPTISTNERAQLHFDRLWDDLLQNEHLRLIQRNTTGTGNNGTSNNSNSDHHRLHSSEDPPQNNESGAGGGGSDGASTSSETAAAVANNAQSLLGDVSTSESDSDSNVSTENDERNGDDDDEEEDEDDGNEEGMEDRSETDADEETRQFIEVYDHMYEPESSETASNDADVDADDEASEVGGGVIANSNHPSATVTVGGGETSSLETHVLSEEDQQDQRGGAAVSNLNAQASETPADEMSDAQNTGIGQSFGASGGAADDNASNAVANSVRTTPTVAWGAPRVAIIGTLGNMNYRPTYAEAAAFDGRNENNDTNHGNAITTNSQFPITNNQRREQTRRLVFLDQQYCAPMPSFGNPTEEGQIEIFNQDALHWWLEEAKYLDLESQTDACLYVAHFLVPFLIKELKLTRVQKNKTEIAAKDSTNTEGAATSTNRRSAIPVLIPQTANSAVGANQSTTAPAANAIANEAEATAMATQETSEASGVQTGSLEAQMPLDGTEREQLGNRNINEHQNLSSSNANDVDNDGEDDDDDDDDDNYTGEEDDGDDQDGDDQEDADDVDDELNTAFMREEELNSNFDIDFNNALRTAISEQLSDQPSIRTASEQSTEHDAAASEDTENMSIGHDSVQVQINADDDDNAAPVDVSEQSAATVGVSQPGGEVDGQAEQALSMPDITAETTAAAAAANVTSTGATARPPPPPNVPDMSPEVRAALGDLEVPEGVDPSFLAALPSEMREEVIQEHLRMQRVRLRAQQNAIQVAHESLLEVNPEFLAALPPNIQSEVLMQQRIEQQRQAAQTANPEDPVDTAAFFQNLPESLRQAILTDMEESQIASLPPDLAAEAQYLRRDWESRNGARLEASQSHALDGYLTARLSSIQNLSDESRWHTNSIWYDVNGMPQSQHHQHTTIVHQQHLHGKPIALLLMEDENNMLDPDALTTLLLFLFIDDQKINYTRLHRVIRNLCYHPPTREWIINALISIIQKTNEGKVQCPDLRSIKPQWLKLKVDAAFGYKSNVFIISESQSPSPSSNGGAFSPPQYTISINPQAAQMIVRNCLELLFVLAKHFSSSFVPFNRDLKEKPKPTVPTPKPTTSSTSSDSISNAPMAVTITAGPVSVGDIDMSPEELQAILHRHQNSRRTTSLGRLVAADGRVVGPGGDAAKLDDCPSTSKAAAAAVRNQQKSSLSVNKNRYVKGLQYNTNAKHFWDVLLNIDMHSQKRMANINSFPINSYPPWEWEIKNPEFLSFNDSPFARLLEMLPYKVICRSPQLTDMLVKLLASLSNELPREDDGNEQTPEESANAQNTATVSHQAAAAETTAASSEQSNTPQSAEGMQESGEQSSVDSQIPEEGRSRKAQTTQSPANQPAQPQPTSQQTRLKRKMYSKNFSQLQIVIEVLTHQCGTTDGLDNISKLIVNLSQCSQASNAIFLQYLSAAIMGLAEEVREAIQSLLDEIRIYNASIADKAATAAAAASSSSSTYLPANNPGHKGIMQDRFTTENVIISAPANVRPCELQLPAMKKLLSSSSAQPYFLRTLKIFIQVRELFEAQENSSSSGAAANTSANKPTLSQIICLDNLWNTLSDCLVALEESKDEYAVLVLQPAVEAFFLIHASQKKNNQRNNRTAAAQANNAQAANNAAVAEEDSNSNNSPTTSNESNTPAASAASQSQEANNTTANVPAVVPASERMEVSPSPNESQLKLDRLKFLSFAEKHRTVLNQILRQSPMHLSDGPFAVLVDHTRILDFDVKRKYFQTELERLDEGVRREENTVSVRRVTVFEDSFRVLYRLGPEEWKNRFYIVFEDEEGQDAGGLLREWYVIISREIFNPMYALFCVSPGDRVTYMINPSSHANPNHLSYFKFVGRVIAKAVHDNKLLECYFTRSFYKHILGKQVKHTDMESQDYEFYKGLDYLMKNDISTLGYELTFSTEVQEFGVTQVRDLIPNGRNIPVTEENKFEYVQLVCQLKMSGSIRQQLDAFLEGFYDIIPKHLISIFNEQELELLISGLPDIDIEDLKANTEYHKYTSKSIQIQWFWRALRSFDQADRAKFLQFVTGTSKVPLQGFGSLEGMNGIQKFQIHRDDRSTDRLPCAHTCFNQLDLPMYKSYEKLRSCLLKAIHECSEGFGFA